MKRFIITLIMVLQTAIFAQKEIDKIVAVVDNEIILKSELDFQTNLMSAQRKLNPQDPKVRSQVLNALIEEKLLYAQAKLDSINVTDEDVNRRLEYQIQMFIQQYGSREKVEQMYGMSIDKIKRELRDDVKKNLMSQTLQEKKFGMLESSRKEVSEFFQAYKDSMGIIPEKFKIAHIFINPKAGDKVKKKARELAQALLDSIKAGSDFSQLAARYSEDPGSAKSGGDIGFVKKGKLFPEYEAAAFALNENELSQIIETPVGFHIIQLLEKRGESIRTRHILIKIKTDDAADYEAINLLNDIKDSVKSGRGTFEKYAVKYSNDKETSKLGGILGNFDAGQLDKSILETVQKMKTGEISSPKRMDMQGGIYGYHIVYLIKRTSEHRPDMEMDYEEIKQLADMNKKQKSYAKWMQELKNKIYWEIR